MFALALVATLVSAAPNPLVGRWDNGAGFVLVLDASGAGTMSDGAGVPPERITWKGSGKSLAITQDGETVTYAVSVSKDALHLSGGDLDQPVSFKRAGSAGAVAQQAPDEQPQQQGQQQPRQPKQLPPNAAANCLQACQFFLTCAAQLGAISTANPQVQVACLQECQASGMTPYQLAVFTNLSCQQAVTFVIAAEQAARGQQQQRQKRQTGACQGCVRWGDDCMWSSQSDWGPGHYGNSYSGAVSSCDPSCCGM
jgi:hypothetical protein